MGYHHPLGDLAMPSRPKRIAISHSKRLFSIEWEDGELCEYPLSGLRAACPCAECRGGHENMGKPGSPEMLEIPIINMASSELDRVEQVGNYAIQLFWKDGHSYGIYTWQYLKELCPKKLEESEFV
jgi:DUF971 family protein